MYKKIILAGLAGGMTLIVLAILVNGFFGFKYRMEMKHVPDEETVYQVLKQHIAEPGRYLCNPPLTATGAFPENEPVFSILYSGMGHEAAGIFSVVLDVLFALFTATLCAWLLSLASEKNLARYPRKVLFVILIGLTITVFSDSDNCGIGNYPLWDTLILAAYHLFQWILLGLVVSLFIRPAPKT